MEFYNDKTKTTSTTAMKKRDEPTLLVRQRPVKRIKRDFRSMLQPTLPNAAACCKPCDPSQGLAIGNRPITVAELNQLTPDDLTEHPITRNGVELNMEDLLELLDMPKEFAELVVDDDDDDKVAYKVADEGDNNMVVGRDDNEDMGTSNNAATNYQPGATTPFLPPNPDEMMYLAFANQFR